MQPHGRAHINDVRHSARERDRCLAEDADALSDIGVPANVVVNETATTPAERKCFGEHGDDDRTAAAQTRLLRGERHRL